LAAHVGPLRNPTAARMLFVAFAVSFATAAWSAVVVGRLIQLGEGPADLGALFAVCEASRLPVLLVLPQIIGRFGAARVPGAALLGTPAPTRSRPGPREC
jgi:hypothetical protein